MATNTPGSPFVDSPSVNFIDNHLPQTDPTFSQLGATTTFDAGIGWFMPNEPPPVPVIQDTPEMLEQKQKFRQAVAEYQRRTGKATDVKLDGSHQYTWTDVLSEMQKALEAYQNVRNDGMSGYCRHWLRKSSDLRKPIESWLRILPTESWQGSVICGGLKLVLSAISRLGELREDVAAALERIPLTMSKVYALLGIYDDAFIQREHVSQLFVLILDIFGQCLNQFGQKPVKKFVGAVIKSESYGESLRKSIDRLAQLETRIDGQAMVGLHNSTRLLHGKMNREAVVMNNMYNMLTDIHTMETDRADLKRQYDEIAKRQKELEAERSKVAQREKEVLSRLIRYDPRIPVQDLRESLTVGSASTHDVQDRAAWILQSDATHAWLSGSDSSTLIVNGNAATHESNSAVSLFSAMLVQSVSKADKDTVLLYWLCGQHIHDTPNELVRSLLGQLLSKGTSDMPTKIDGFDLDDFDVLVEVFTRCLRTQLEKTSVFCIFDSVSFYEDRRRADDLKYIFDNMVSMTNKRHAGGRLKMLITSPVMTISLNTSTANKRLLSLTVPDVVEGTLSSLSEAF